MRSIKNIFSNQSERKVDFIICGTQKGGTTALDVYLRENPSICMAEKKEVHFFDNEENFAKKADYSSYHSLFNPTSSHKLLGEATPIYMYWYSAPRRIWEYNQDIKLIVLLRNPIERAYSHWNMERSRGYESLPFWEAIQNERQRCMEALPLQHRVYSYIDRGFYVEQLRRLWAFFPKNQTLVLKSERLKYQPQEALHEVYSFLGVDGGDAVSFKDVHSRKYDLPMTNKERSHLRYIYEFEIRELERELGWDCSDWLK